jgi:DNA primase
MEMEGLDFKGALELLARKVGVDLDQYRTKGSSYKGPKKERLYELLDLAAKFYQVQFSKNKIALEYVLGKREFSKETALEWRLGYSPNTGGALLEYAKSRGFTEAELKAAGLTSERYGRTSDMFRGRLMIPLMDPQGKVIGFTARQLEEDPNGPKYINTPQTVLYDKSRHVFGLHLAKEQIRRTKFVVLVEGNLDVIASHQAGVRQVVATAGTALTEPNVKALSRFTGDIRLSFDADRAGVAATERAIPIASKVGVTLSIIDIPAGKDPDELIKQNPKAWKEAIEQNKYALDWLIERYTSLLDLTSAPGKREFSNVLLPVVRRLKDSVEQDHYLRKIAEQIGVSYEALQQKMLGGEMAEPQKVLKKPKVRVELDKQAIEYAKVQDHFLALMLLQPPLRDYLNLMEPEMFTAEPARQLLEFLMEHPEFSGQPAEVKKLSQRTQGLPSGSAVAGSAGDRGDGVHSFGDYVKILLVQYDELYQGLEFTELHYEAARLQARLVEQFVKHKKEQLVNEMAGADTALTTTLLEQVKELDTLLKHVKGGTHAG